METLKYAFFKAKYRTRSWWARLYWRCESFLPRDTTENRERRFGLLSYV